MHIAGVIFESMGLMLGAIAAALLLCTLFWWAGRAVGHPAWGALLTLLLVPLAFALPGMPFLDMAVIFALLFAIPLWIEGRAWRLRHD